MEISNNTVALLLKNQNDIMETMQENKILLNRLEEYIRLLLITNLVNDYENTVFLQSDNAEYRKLLTQKMVGILKNRLCALEKNSNCYEEFP